MGSAESTCATAGYRRPQISCLDPGSDLADALPPATCASSTFPQSPAQSLSTHYTSRRPATRQSRLANHIPTSSKRNRVEPRETDEREPEEKPEEPSPKKPKPASSKEDVVLEELKKTGMTAENAKTLLKTWADVGVEDPKQLRKLLVNRSIKPLTGLTFQTLIDVVAAAGGLYIVDLLPKEDPIFGSIFIEALGYFFFIYYSIQVLLDVSVAGAVIYSTYRYGTSSTELLSAVKKLAQPKSMGLSVVDKAQVAVNTLKVLQTMETVATMLQGQVAVNTLKVLQTMETVATMLQGQVAVNTLKVLQTMETVATMLQEQYAI
eukprot:gene17161-23472_t